MPSLSGEVILTHFQHHNEKLSFGTKFLSNKMPKVKKGSSLWRDQIVSSLMPFSPFKSKKEKAKHFILQETMYNKVNRDYTSLMRKQSLFIGADIELPRQLSKTGSSGSISAEYQSDSESERTASGSYSSSADCSSLSSSESSEFGSMYDIKEEEDSQELGNVGSCDRLSDPCLSLDGFDVTDGVISWQSVNNRADLVLDYWCSRSSRRVNRVLPNASDFVCPEPSLHNRLLLTSKKSHKPLKRWNSYEDIYEVTKQAKGRRTSSKTKVSMTDETLFPKYLSPKVKAKPIDCHRTESTNELTILDPISSPMVSEKSETVVKGSRMEAKSLLRNITAPSPLSLALYLTKLDRHYFMQLKDYQLFDCMTGCDFDNQKKDLTELEDMFEFGQELNKFVVSIIRKQLTPESQARKIAGFIEVVCALRKLRNWHSLVAVMNALQSPKVYFLEEAWMAVRKAFPVHFSDYTKLCRLVRLNQTCIIGSTIGASIPSLASLLTKITIHCIATWDLLDHKRRWTEQPSIAGWVDNELIGQLVESQKRRQKQEERHMLSMEPNKDSLLPDGDPIRLVPFDTLPVNWRRRDVRYVRQSYMRPIVRCFQSSFQKEMHSIRLYTIPAPYT